MRAPLLVVVLLLAASTSAAAQGVSIHFHPESARFAEAAGEYQALWAAEGDRIVAALEDVSGLTFVEREIRAVVQDGPSRSGVRRVPMRIGAGYAAGTKKATLVHELGHRHLAQLRWRPPGLDEHRVLFLILYDVWEKLYGREFGRDQVEVESQRSGVYDYAAAWRWALGQRKDERARRFREIVVKNRPD